MKAKQDHSPVWGKFFSFIEEKNDLAMQSKLRIMSKKAETGRLTSKSEKSQTQGKKQRFCRKSSAGKIKSNMTLA